jgi:hypothetical protein
MSRGEVHSGIEEPVVGASVGAWRAVEAATPTRGADAVHVATDDTARGDAAGADEAAGC